MMKQSVISHFEGSAPAFGLTEEQVCAAVHQVVEQLGLNAFQAFLNDYKLTPDAHQLAA
jgi:hypothetical protein